MDKENVPVSINYGTAGLSKDNQTHVFILFKPQAERLMLSPQETVDMVKMLLKNLQVVAPTVASHMLSELR